MFHYDIMERVVDHPKVGKYVELSVIARKDKQIYLFRDLNFSKPKLLELVEICNRCDLSPIQFDEVASDFIKMNLVHIEPEIMLAK